MTWDDLVGWLVRELHLRHHDAEDAAARGMAVAWEKGHLNDGAYVRACARRAGLQLCDWKRRDDQKIMRWYVPAELQIERHGEEVVLTNGTDHLVPLPVSDLTECGHDPSEIVWQQNGKGRARRCRACDRERKRELRKAA